MSIYWRMLKRLRPYLPQLVLSVIFTMLFSLLNSAIVFSVQPLLRALFATEEVLDAAAAPPAADGERDLGLGAPAEGSLPVIGEDSWIREQLQRLHAAANAHLLEGSRLDALWRIVQLAFFLFLAKNITQYLGTVLIVWVGLRVIKDLRDELYAKLTHLPLSFYNRYRSGELISRAMNDVQIANNCIHVSFTNLVRDPILIATFMAACLYISWKLTLLSLTVLPLSMLVIIRVGKLLRRYSHRQQERLADLTSVLQETVYGIRVIKAFAMERFETRKYLQESDRLFSSLFKIARVQRISSPLTEQLSVIVAVVILWLGGRQVLAEETLSPDMFLTYLFCLFSMVRPIKELGQVNNGIQEGMAAAQRVFAVLDVPAEKQDAEAGTPVDRVEGRVEFENVSFSYLPGIPVLCDIDLRVDPGEIVALVGGSGAGKSTLVDLIPRFYEPTGGRILVDGRDIAGLSLASLRRAMGIVTQEVILFNASVKANIAYGLEDVDDRALVAAAEAANAHGFISELPRGYETLIGDRGTRLSGGQRQRISIARAILKNPPILILDEATSALDTESEQLVQEAIDRLVQNRTTFVIAHRLSTIQNAHRIYVLKAGRIVEVGDHVSLLAAGGVYAELYHRQFRHEEEAPQSRTSPGGGSR
ncbi:MAG: ABC transporter ATP-binding protein [Candidatus Krumholzibacteriia bacterium]